MELTLTENVSYKGKILKRGETHEFDAVTAKVLQDDNKAVKPADVKVDKTEEKPEPTKPAAKK